MSLELINFVYDSIASGAVGNGAYDIMKSLFNKSFERLLNYVGDNDKNNFKNTLEILLESNEELKNKLMALKNGGNLSEVSGNKKTEINIESRTPNNKSIVKENEDSKVNIKNL
jgi:hypothetical protein